MTDRYLAPLDLHVLCVGETDSAARAAADHLDRLFQGDPLLHSVSPVDIPTFALPVTASGPAPVRWGDASQHCVIVFIDDRMYADRTVWGPWLDALAADAKEQDALVITVTDDAGSLANLSPALAARQVVRVPSSGAPGESKGEVWAGEVALRTLRALASYLARDGEGRGRLFLSHAKEDGRWLADALRDYVASKDDGLAFFDEVALRTGEAFDEGLLKGFDGAVVVALVTDAYSGRFGCVWEVVTGTPRRAGDLAHRGGRGALRAGDPAAAGRGLGL